MRSNGEPSPSLKTACALLFGRACCAEDFLSTIDRNEARSAFRRRALLTHPDRAKQLNEGGDELALRFKELLTAYQLLDEYLANLPPRDSAPAEEDERGAEPVVRDRSARRDLYHRGPLPQRPLLFAEYLYYSRLIPHRLVTKAVLWQRASRAKLGEDALSMGLIDEATLHTILSARNRGRGERFGECAERLGLISSFWIKALLRRQRERQPRIGQYFVLQDRLKPEDLEHALRFQRLHNARFRSAWTS